MSSPPSVVTVSTSSKPPSHTKQSSSVRATHFKLAYWIKAAVTVTSSPCCQTLQEGRPSTSTSAVTVSLAAMLLSCNEVYFPSVLLSVTRTDSTTQSIPNTPCSDNAVCMIQLLGSSMMCPFLQCSCKVLCDRWMIVSSS